MNAVPGYRRLFGEVYKTLREGAPVDFEMFARAIAEFEFSLTFADAPIDRYARGANGALDSAEKRGALLFFGKAGCAQCHAVSGSSDEMFTDFQEHAIAAPQIVPSSTNNTFDGLDANQDFGREDAAGDPADRYRFRTPSLRNVAVEAAYMHDGAFRTLAAAIRHHLDAIASLKTCNRRSRVCPPTSPARSGRPRHSSRRSTRASLPRSSSRRPSSTTYSPSSATRSSTHAQHRKSCESSCREVPSGRPVLSFEFWTRPGEPPRIPNSRSQQSPGHYRQVARPRPIPPGGPAPPCACPERAEEPGAPSSGALRPRDWIGRRAPRFCAVALCEDGKARSAGRAEDAGGDQSVGRELVVIGDASGRARDHGQLLGARADPLSHTSSEWSCLQQMTRESPAPGRRRTSWTLARWRLAVAG